VFAIIFVYFIFFDSFLKYEKHNLASSRVPLTVKRAINTYMFLLLLLYLYRGPIYPLRACKFKCSFTPENSKLYWQSQLERWSSLMVSTGSQTSLKYNYYQVNCGNNKMLESDWFLTALIYCLIWLVQHQTVRFEN